MFSYGKVRLRLKKLKEKGGGTTRLRRAPAGCGRLCKKISACLLLSGARRRQASMTVEAAFVLPMFLFAIMNILSIVELYRLQGNLSAAMHNAAKKMAVYAYAIDDASEVLTTTYAAASVYAELGNDYLDSSPKSGIINWLDSDMTDDDCIDLVARYRVKPFYGLMGYSSFTLLNRARTRAWTGYDNAGAAANGSEEQLVYITENGTVYHTTKNCTYLNLSIRAVDKDSLDTLRNNSGGIYYACEKCGDSDKSTVYITTYGSSWHSTLNCSGLKRTIYLVPISQVEGRDACSKCGG